MVPLMFRIRRPRSRLGFKLQVGIVLTPNKKELAKANHSDKVLEEEEST